MPNRRQFLQTGAAMSALAVHGLVPRGAAAASVTRSGIALHKAIYDNRYAECREFAATVAALGVTVRALEHGDVTDFWYDELDLLWRKERVSIAGATQFGPMFVLERLARERGLRLVLRVEHQPRTDGTIAHVISAPSETIGIATELCAAGLEWPVVMAGLVCRGTTAAPPPLASATLLTAGANPELVPGPSGTEASSMVHYYTLRTVQEGYGDPLDGPLYSWVVAPI